MRSLERSSEFKRDYKRARKGQHRATLVADLDIAVRALASDTLLAVRYRDHELKGQWAGYRECHIKPDLLLIYCKPTPNVLRMLRLGSHSELFG